MTFVPVHELLGLSDDFCRRIEAGEEFVITRDGRSFALLVRTEAAAIEGQLRALRLHHFGEVVRSLQEAAAASGANQLTDEEIQAEIDAVREERRRAARGG